MVQAGSMSGRVIESEIIDGTWFIPAIHRLHTANFYLNTACELIAVLFMTAFCGAALRNGAKYTHIACVLFIKDFGSC